MNLDSPDVPPSAEIAVALGSRWRAVIANRTTAVIGEPDARITMHTGRRCAVIANHRHGHDDRIVT